MAESITLAWDSESDTNVQGYIVSYGTVRGLPTASIDTGTTTYVTVTSLEPGQTYYFSVAAYNTNHVIGPRSAEIAYLVPGLKLESGSSPGDPMTMSFPVVPGHWYEVQATTDLVTWQTACITPVYTFNDWISFQDFDSTSYPQRFYRLVSHLAGTVPGN